MSQIMIPKLPTTPSHKVEVRTRDEGTPIASLSYSITISKLTHDAELSNLWDYYETHIKGSRKMKYNCVRTKDKQARKRARESKECNQRCDNINFTYPFSAIYRHPDVPEFGRRLMMLGYRACNDCHILIPKSIIFEIEAQRDAHKSRADLKIRKEGSPVRCPCCRSRTVLAKVLIRKTKMGKLLFKGEGY